MKIKSNRKDNATLIITIAIIIITFSISGVLGIVAIAGLFIYYTHRTTVNQSTKKDYGFLGDTEDYIRAIMALTAYMTKADKKVTQRELEFVKRSLYDDFESEYAFKYYKIYKGYLQVKIDADKICRHLNLELSVPSRIQLLHFLTSIVGTDNYLSKEEEHKLYHIGRQLRLAASQVRSIINLFRFTREYDQQSRSKQKTSRPKTSTSQLKLAYGVLGLEESASDDQIKKAYRKLAKVHHPDRVIHLGPEFQKKAKEKFQKIADAYELIKTRRNFN